MSFIYHYHLSQQDNNSTTMDSDEECIKILRAVIEEVKDDLHLVRQLEGHLEDAFKRLAHINCQTSMQR